MTITNGILTIEKVIDGSVSPPLYLYSLKNSTQGSTPGSIACAITSPAAGAHVTQGTPVTITGTVSVDGTVVVKLGSTTLGSATMSGLSWSYSWTPQVGDVGAETLNAVATATVGGATGNATPVAITVDSAGASISAAITFPTAAYTATEGVPYTITGTISVPGTVVVLLGATVLGQASVVGLNWTFSYWVPQNADIGSKTLNATATATSGGSTGNAPGIAVTVAAATTAKWQGAIGELALGAESAVGGGIVPHSLPITSALDSALFGAGNTPQALPSDTYTTGDTFRRWRIKVGAGVTSLGIVATPWNRSGANPTATTIGVWIDDVFSQTLTYSGTLGVRATQPLTLDGLAHTIDFEEQAALVDITGTYTVEGYTPPAVRVALIGDSITAATPASVPSKGYAPILRHQLSAGYKMTIWGRSGMTMVARANAADIATIVSRLDGTSKNIVCIPLMINDFINGVPLSSYTTAAAFMRSQIISAMPSAKVLFVTSPQTALAGGGGGTIQQYRDIVTALATANPTDTFVCDLAALYPGSSPWSSSTTDGVHPVDSAEPLWSTAILAAINAL